jgi:hypothetical protein
MYYIFGVVLLQVTLLVASVADLSVPSAAPLPRPWLGPILPSSASLDASKAEQWIILNAFSSFANDTNATNATIHFNATAIAPLAIITETPSESPTESPPNGATTYQ